MEREITLKFLYKNKKKDAEIQIGRCTQSTKPRFIFYFYISN